MMKKLLILAAFLCSLGSAQATTRYVDNGSTGCSSPSDTDYTVATRTCGAGAEKVWDTINGGMGDTASQDILEIRAGTYDEGIDDDVFVAGGGTWATATIYRAYLGENVILKPSVATNCAGGNDNRLIWFDTNWIIMDGITADANDLCIQTIIFDNDQTGADCHHNRFINGTIINGRAVGVKALFESIAERTECHHNEVVNNLIDDNGETGFDHGLYISTDNNIISGNTISNNFDQGIQVFHDGEDSAFDNQVFDNIIFGNGGYGIITGSGDNNLIYNNVIYDNGFNETNGCIFVRFGGDNNRIYNNTCVDNTTFCVDVFSGMTGTIVQNNLCFMNGNNSIEDEGTGSVINNNNFPSVSTEFVDYALDDFRPVSGASCKDQGVNLAGVFAADVDINSVVRPQGTSWDACGAYEFIEDTPPDPGCSGGAIVFTNGVSGFDGTDADPYATASWTPTADRVAFAFLLFEDATGTPPTPTASGNGLTWTDEGSTTRGSRGRYIIFSAPTGSSPSTGVTTFTFGETQDWGAWIIIEGTNIDEATSVVQLLYTADNSSPLLTTLSAFGSTDNATVGFGGNLSANRDYVAGSGFTELAEVDVTSEGSISVEWRDDNDTTVDMTFGADTTGGIYGLEIARAGAACIGLPRAMEVGMEVGMIEGVNP